MVCECKCIYSTIKPPNNRTATIVFLQNSVFLSTSGLCAPSAAFLSDRIEHPSYASHITSFQHHGLPSHIIIMLSKCYVLLIIAWVIHFFLLSECECFTPVTARSSLPSSSSSRRHHPYYRKHLTTTASDNDDNHANKQTFLRHAVAKFMARPSTYLLIPCVAAAVGWFTNWLAVQMIFYPIQFRGIPIYQKPEVPLGLLGWQGIVPCKTRPMTLVMVNM